MATQSKCLRIYPETKGLLKAPYLVPACSADSTENLWRGANQIQNKCYSLDKRKKKSILPICITRRWTVFKATPNKYNYRSSVMKIWYLCFYVLPQLINMWLFRNVAIKETIARMRINIPAMLLTSLLQVRQLTVHTTSDVPKRIRSLVKVRHTEWDHAKTCWDAGKYVVV